MNEQNMNATAEGQLSNSEGHLRSLVERIERLEEDKAAISADIKEVYAEARSTGFDPKIIRLLIRLRKKEPAERAEEEAILSLYMTAIGMRPEPEAA